MAAAPTDEPITFPNAQSFMERVRREGRKQMEAVLSEIGLANLDELKSLVERSRTAAPASPPAAPAVPGAAGGGSGAPTPQDQEIAKLRAENEQLKAQARQVSKRLDAVTLEGVLRQEAILSGITQPAYVEAALALLRAESATKRKAGEEVDTQAFFAGLKATNPALFERSPANPARTGTNANPPTPAAPAGAGEPTPDAMSMTDAQWRAHKASKGML